MSNQMDSRSGAANSNAANQMRAGIVPGFYTVAQQQTPNANQQVFKSPNAAEVAAAAAARQHAMNTFGQSSNAASGSWNQKAEWRTPEQTRFLLHPERPLADTQNARSGRSNAREFECRASYANVVHKQRAEASEMARQRTGDVGLVSSDLVPEGKGAFQGRGVSIGFLPCKNGAVGGGGCGGGGNGGGGYLGRGINASSVAGSCSRVGGGCGGVYVPGGHERMRSFDARDAYYNDGDPVVQYGVGVTAENSRPLASDVSQRRIEQVNARMDPADERELAQQLHAQQGKRKASLNSNEPLSAYFRASAPRMQAASVNAGEAERENYNAAYKKGNEEAYAQVEALQNSMRGYKDTSGPTMDAIKAYNARQSGRRSMLAGEL